jgi:MtN3 and saliva related transmembrane protein
VTSQLGINAIGVLAALCSMSSFIPQAHKIFRERDASSVSVRMCVIMVAGFALWTLYGVLLKSWPLVGSNLVSLALASLILMLKLRYPGSKPSKAMAT